MLWRPQRYANFRFKCALSFVKGLWDDEKVLRWTVSGTVTTVLNAAVLYPQKWLKRYTLCYVYFTLIFFFFKETWQRWQSQGEI